MSLGTLSTLGNPALILYTILVYVLMSSPFSTILLNRRSVPVNRQMISRALSPFFKIHYASVLVDPVFVGVHLNEYHYRKGWQYIPNNTVYENAGIRAYYVQVELHYFSVSRDTDYKLPRD